MSYSKRDDVPVRLLEAAIELDAGILVAVMCTRAAAGAVIIFSASARAIHPDGSAQLSALGIPIETSLTHQGRDAATADAVARDCLLAVLGEPVSVVQWGEDLLRDVSIRNAISINNVTSTVDAAQVL
ncbi:hypothetical protein ACCQ12_15145 [Xanthomonas sp. NCPPB 1068]|uniref:hypothetical protein n=1 Tax=Xanthomonas sp. NCPPB 1068 TaxID=487525 RepID=UPI003555CA09